MRAPLLALLLAAPAFAGPSRPFEPASPAFSAGAAAALSCPAAQDFVARGVGAFLLNQRPGLDQQLALAPLAAQLASFGEANFLALSPAARLEALEGAVPAAAKETVWRARRLAAQAAKADIGDDALWQASLGLTQLARHNAALAQAGGFEARELKDLSRQATLRLANRIAERLNAEGRRTLAAMERQAADGVIVPDSRRVAESRRLDKYQRNPFNVNNKNVRLASETAGGAAMILPPEKAKALRERASRLRFTIGAAAAGLLVWGSIVLYHAHPMIADFASIGVIIAFLAWKAATTGRAFFS